MGYIWYESIDRNLQTFHGGFAPVAAATPMTIACWRLLTRTPVGMRFLNPGQALSPAGRGGSASRDDLIRDYGPMKASEEDNGGSTTAS